MTLDDYIRSADSLAGRGEKVTLRTVRAEAGGGSFSSISNALRIWRVRQSELSTVEPTNPPPELSGVLDALWRQALEVAQAQVAAERAALTAARLDSEQVQNDALETADDLAGQVEALTSDLERERNQRSRLEKKLAQTQAELAATQSLCENKLATWLGQPKPKN